MVVVHAAPVGQAGVFKLEVAGGRVEVTLILSDHGSVGALAAMEFSSRVHSQAFREPTIWVSSWILCNKAKSADKLGARPVLVEGAWGTRGCTGAVPLPLPFPQGI